MTVAVALAEYDDSDEHLALIKKAVDLVAQRYCWSTEEREDFPSYAWLRILEGDLDIRTFQERDANLYTRIAIFRRLLHEYRSSVRRKRRVAAKHEHVGPIPVTLERLVSRDRFTLEAAYEILTTNHRVEMVELEELAAQIPIRHPGGLSTQRAER